MKSKLLIVFLFSAVATAQALINVHFTPVDLVKAAKDIYLVDVSTPKDGKALAETRDRLKGGDLPRTLTLDLSEAGDQTMEDLPRSATTALLFTGDFSKASSTGSGDGEKPAAVIQIGIHWFVLFKTGDAWKVGKDPLDLSAVWGGSAAMLAECVKYILADPRADVPTTAGLKFVSDEKLGVVTGKVSRIEWLGNGKVDTKPAGASLELVSDYDGDGKLDKLVAKPEGPQLLRGQSENVTLDTGELDYHSRSKPDLTGIVDCDFNCDGRPDVLLVYGKGLAPLAFFNRGFGCFGIARELMLDQSELKGAQALADGCQAATFVDVNGDGSPDLLAVVPNGEIWVLYTKLDREPGPVVVVSSTEPVTVTAQAGEQRLGARLASPGMPARFHLAEPGPVTLHWQLPGGTMQEKKLIVEKGCKQFVIPAATK